MNCNICKKKLDQPGDPTTKNCGGDCLYCMATIGGDPDCIRKLAELGTEKGIELLAQLKYEEST